MFARRYMLWGAAFGCAFPVVATLVEALVRHGGLAPRSLAAAQRSPLLWIIDSAPLWLGLFARLAGVRQDGLVAAEAVRRAEAVRAADELAEAARQLAAAADQLRERAAQQSATASQQAAAVAETTTSAAEIAQTAGRSAERARQVIEVADRSGDLSRDGQRAVERAVSGIEGLGDLVASLREATAELAADAQRIGDIVSSVKELADKSNILGLNASIQASRAGEHGRGFSIVAQEMRALAEASRSAAVEARGILDGLLGRVRRATEAANAGSDRSRQAVSLAHEAAEVIDGLAGLVQDSAGSAKEIAEAARQGRIGIDQIAAAMQEVSTATSDTVKGAASIQAAAAALLDTSRRLGDAVERYRADAARAPDHGSS
jgi:methyl-accepting chemotaxis protein